MNIEHVASGKVRDVYLDRDNSVVYLVAGDGVSAFDSVIPGLEIKGKGEILTSMSYAWANLIDSWNRADGSRFIETALKPIEIEEKMQLIDHDIAVHCVCKEDYLLMFPVEAIVRGYITGSLWADYESGVRTFCGYKLSDGLKNSSRLFQPIFTPTTKAPQGQHDENIDMDQMIQILNQFVAENGICASGRVIANVIRDASLNIYAAAENYAKGCGVIIADTKFEFGWDPNTETIKIADEILTPDSSRFWFCAEYAVGEEQKSMDKQIIRDEVKRQKAAGVAKISLPPEVITKTGEAYRLIYEMLFNYDGE